MTETYQYRSHNTYTVMDYDKASIHLDLHNALTSCPPHLQVTDPDIVILAWLLLFKLSRYGPPMGPSLAFLQQQHSPFP